MVKCWRPDKNGRFFLYKGGNTCINEYLASQVARYIGIPHNEYMMGILDGIECCICEDFCGGRWGFLSFAEWVKGLGDGIIISNWNDVLDKIGILGEDYIYTICSMRLFDYIIGNSDRHLNNFGFLFNRDTLEIVSMAPLYDHDMSLLDGKRVLLDIDLFRKYVNIESLGRLVVNSGEFKFHEDAYNWVGNKSIKDLEESINNKYKDIKLRLKI